MEEPDSARLGVPVAQKRAPLQFSFAMPLGSVLYSLPIVWTVQPVDQRYQNTALVSATNVITGKVTEYLTKNSG